MITSTIRQCPISLHHRTAGFSLMLRMLMFLVVSIRAVTERNMHAEEKSPESRCIDPNAVSVTTSEHNMSTMISGNDIVMCSTPERLIASQLLICGLSFLQFWKGYGFDLKNKKESVILTAYSFFLLFYMQIECFQTITSELCWQFYE